MILASDKLRRYVELTGLSQSELAERIGIDESQLNQLLNRKIEPTKRLMDLICLYTGLPLDAVWEVTDAKVETP